MKDIIHSAIFALLVVLSGSHGQMLQSITNAQAAAAAGPNCSLCVVRQFVTSNGSGTATHPESFTASTTAGDAIIIWNAHTNWSGSGTSTVSSVEGDTWHPCDGTGTGPFTTVQFASTWGIDCHYAVNIPGGSTDTITVVPSDCASNCTSIGNAIVEISGVASTAVAAWDGWGKHANGVAASGSNNTTCGSVTATQANDFVICGMDQSTGSATAGTSPNNFGTLVLSGGTNVAVEKLVWSGSGAINPTITDSVTSDTYGSVVVLFK